MGEAAGIAQTVQAGAQFAGGLVQAQAIRDVGAFEADAARLNERLAELQGKQAIARGKKDAANLKRGVKQLIGEQRAAFAAQGIEVGSGSALEIQEETAALGELDAITIRNNAQREAFGFRVQGLQAAQRAQFARISAEQRAGATILTGGLRAAQTFSRFSFGNGGGGGGRTGRVGSVGSARSFTGAIRSDL